MRLMLALLAGILFYSTAVAQSSPAHWSFKSKKISDTEYDLVLTAKVDQGWFIYSQYLESDEGPIATSITFDENKNVELKGKASEEGHKKEGFDDIFGMKLIKFSDEVTFTQRIQLKGKVEMVTGALEFMTCNDERCLPPTTVSFEIKL